MRSGGRRLDARCRAEFLENLITLGSLLIQRGDHAEAASIFEPMRDSDRRTAVWLAYIDFCRGDHARARRACDEILAEDDHALALWIRGHAAFALRDHAAARTDHDRAFELDPRVNDLWR